MRGASVRGGAILAVAAALVFQPLTAPAFALDAPVDTVPVAAADAPVAPPAAEPVAAPVAEPAPEPAPVPEPVPVPEPAPAPAPVPVPEPVPVVEPAPVPVPEPAPEPAPAAPDVAQPPAPEPTVSETPAVPEETVAPEADTADPAPDAAAEAARVAAEELARGGGKKDKVTLCHATSSVKNPWVQITVAADGAASGHAGAHHQDGRDIIPPFSYTENRQVQQFPGQNWDAAGQAIYERGCANPPEPPKDPAPTVTLNLGECVEGDTMPSVTAVFGNLVVGQPYTYEGNGQAAVDFVATATSETRSLGAAQGTSVTVDIRGTGPRAAQGSVTRSVQVEKCAEPPEEEVTLCHATSSDSNPWVELTLPPAGVLNGHAGASHQDGRDIIPPFEYGDGESFPGQNWDEDGQAIFENGCAEPEVPVDPDPAVSISAGECPAMGGFAPLTVTLSELVVGEPYTVEFDGVATDASSPMSFTADAATRVIEVMPSEEGALHVTVTGTGEHAGESADATAQVAECPEPELPEITLSLDQCLAYGEPLPAAVTAELSGLVSGVTYTVTIGTEGGGTPYVTRSVDGSEGTTATLQLDLAGTGSYVVTVSVGEEELTRTIEVTPCPPGSYDLSLVKTASAGEAGVAEVGDTIQYSITVTNAGPDAALDPVVTDALPAGLSAVSGTGSGPAGWTVDASGSSVTASYAGAFTGEATITFDALVVTAPPSGEITNQACVAASGVAEPEPQPERAATGLLGLPALVLVDPEAAGDGGDSNSGNDCGSVTTEVRGVAIAGSAVCVNDTPWFTYSVTPSGTADPSELPIVMIWWTADAYAARDASIPAGDTAAILADGASQVDPIAYPDGWVSGQTLSGQMLWPGATVDEDGNPTGWPGWTLQGDGTWVLDPAAPHYNLREQAVVEIRINPTAAETTVYPPATPNCAAQPPQPPVTPEPPVTPPATTPPAAVAPPAPAVSVPGTLPRTAVAMPTRLADTGAPDGASEQRGAIGGLGIAATLAGLALWSFARRRRHEDA